MSEPVWVEDELVLAIHDSERRRPKMPSHKVSIFGANTSS